MESPAPAQEEPFGLQEIYSPSYFSLQEQFKSDKHKDDERHDTL